MSERTNKINGGIGFGYRGEIGDIGNKGANILFSPVGYGDYTSVQNVIPFESGNKYISFEYENLFNKIKSGDYVIVSGDNGIRIHTIIENESALYVKDEPEYDIDMEELPKYQYNANVYTDDDDMICVQQSLSIDNMENARIVGFIDGDKVIFRDFGEQGTSISENTGKEKGGMPHQIVIFMYYKISPYKVIKVFLYETTY